MMQERQSRYCYPNSEVLINKLNLMDEELLNDIERIVTTFRISQLECQDISFGNYFSINSYFKIHEWIFQDIYPFAGHVRDEFIYKSNLPYHKSITPFCDPKYISSYMNDIFKKLLARVKRVKSREEFIECISWFYGEMNVVHPFREGNGRTLRTFMELFVKYVNSYLDIPDMEIHYSLWDDDDRKELLKSTIICSLNGDTSGIEKLFDKVLVTKKEKKKLK